MLQTVANGVGECKEQWLGFMSPFVAEAGQTLKGYFDQMYLLGHPTNMQQSEAPHTNAQMTPESMGAFSTVCRALVKAEADAQVQVQQLEAILKGQSKSTSVRDQA